MKIFKTKTEMATEAYVASVDLKVGNTVSLGASGLAKNKTAPEFICISDTDKDEMALVIRISSEDLYSSKKPSGSLTVGTSYTLDDNGDITSTSTAGIFKVVEIKDDAVIGTI